MQSKKLKIDKKVQTLNANIVSLTELLDSCTNDFNNYCDDTLYLLQQENSQIVDFIKEMYISTGNTAVFESLNFVMDSLQTTNQKIIIELEEILASEFIMGDLASPELSEAIKMKKNLQIFNEEQMKKHEAKLKKLRRVLNHLSEFEIPSINTKGNELAKLSDELSLIGFQRELGQPKLFQNILNNK